MENIVMGPGVYAMAVIIRKKANQLLKAIMGMIPFLFINIFVNAADLFLAK